MGCSAGQMSDFIKIITAAYLPYTLLCVFGYRWRFSFYVSFSFSSADWSYLFRFCRNL